MSHWRYALGLAWHGVRKHPRSSVMVVVVMALGLAACMTVLAVFHVLAADPLPGRSHDLQTVLFTHQGQALSVSDALLNIKLAQRAVDEAGDLPVMALAPAQSTVKRDADDASKVDAVSILAASARVHQVFGMVLHRGRWWTAQEGRDHAPVAVIAPALAQRLFGTDRVLGRQLRVGKALIRIIGVRASWTPSLRFYAQGGDIYGRDIAQLLIPISVAAKAELDSRQTYCYDVDHMSDIWHQCAVAQLWSAGLSPNQRQRLLRVAADVGERIPAPSAATHDPRKPILMNVPAWLRMQHVVPDSVRAYVWVALSFLALCLLNAAGVLAARFMRRSAELGVRRALGAARRDVFAQHMIESGALAAVAGVLAWPLILAAMALLRMQALQFSDLIHFDVGTFLALCVTTLLAGMGVGAYPAWRVAVVPPALQVKQD